MTRSVNMVICDAQDSGQLDRTAARTVDDADVRLFVVRYFHIQIGSFGYNSGQSGGGGGGTASFSETFETGSKTSYTAGNVNLDSGSWYFDDALLGNLSSDVKDGLNAARIKSAGSVSMNFDVQSASQVQMSVANFGSDIGATWKLQKSTDGGSTWTDVFISQSLFFDLMMGRRIINDVTFGAESDNYTAVVAKSTSRYWEKAIQRADVPTIIAEYFHERGFQAFTYVYQTSLLLLCSYQRGRSINVPDKLRNALGGIHSLLENVMPEYSIGEITMGVGKTCFRVQGIHDGFKSAREALKFCQYTNKPITFYHEMVLAEQHQKKSMLFSRRCYMNMKSVWKRFLAKNLRCTTN